MSLKLYVQKLSEKVLAETSIIRSSFKNATNKGSGFEIVIRNLLSSYTPASNFLTHGEIIDTEGHQSGQIDIAIVQDFHPRGYEDGRPNVILFDLVTAIGEVKVNLNTLHLNSTIDNSKTFDSFKRHEENNNMLSRGGLANEEFEELPPYFLVAFSTDIAISTIATRIKASNIDFLVALEHSTENAGIVSLGKTSPKEEVISFMDEIGTRQCDYLWKVENPLMPLIWWLNKEMVRYLNLTNVMPFYLR